MTLHLLTSGVLLERAPTKWRGSSRASSCRSTRRPRRSTARSAASTRWRSSSAASRRLRRLAPDVPVTARATLHRLNFRELPRLIDHAKAMALDGISFLPADVSSSAFGRARSAWQPTRRWRSTRDEIARVRGDRRADDRALRATTSSRASSPSRPTSCGGCRSYYAALGGRRAVSAPSRATRRGCRWSSRPTARCGRASSTSRSATSATDAARRRSSRRNLPAFRQTLDVGAQSGVRALRLLDEDGVEERAVAVNDAGSSTRGAAFDSVAADYDRSNADNPMLCACGRDALRRGAAATCRAGRTCSISAAAPAPMLRPGADRLPRDRDRLVAGDGRRGAPPRAPAPGWRDRVDVHARSASTSSTRWRRCSFDAAYSNFGPLNCVDDLAAARAAHRPAAAAAAACSSRRSSAASAPGRSRCILRAGDWRARRRSASRADAVPVPLEGRTVWTRYYTPAAFDTDRSDRRLHARRRCVRSGCWRRRRTCRRSPAAIRALVARAAALDDALGGWPGVRACGRPLPDRAEKGHEVRRVDAAVRLSGMPDAGARRARRATASAARVRRAFERRGSIWRFLTPARGAAAEPFVAQYRAVRERDGHRPVAPEYYRCCRRAARRSAGRRVADPARELCTICCATLLPDSLARPLRIARCSAPAARGCATGSPRSAITPSRSTARRRGRRPGRVPPLPDLVPGGAGRLRRAAVRAGSVRHGRVQRVAPLRDRSGRDARERAHGCSHRAGDGGDGLADVSRRAATAARWSPTRAAPLWSSSAASARSSSAGAGFLTFARLARVRDAAGAAARVRAVARPARAGGCAGSSARVRLGRAPAAFGVWVAR